MLPLVLGLSHIFGEAPDLEQIVKFWCQHGLDLDFTLHLTVPKEKRQSLLFNRSATSVALQYLRLPKAETDVGIEFLLHQPSVPRAGRCGLILGLHGYPARILQDPMGNRLFFHPQLGPGATVILRSCDLLSSGKILHRLGFDQSFLSKEEAEALLQFVPANMKVWSLGSPLMPRRALKIILEQDPERPTHPPVDLPGWNGLSLLTKNMDALTKIIPLVARQRIDSPRRGNREVAFLSEAGLTLEFLSVAR